MPEMKITGIVLAKTNVYLFSIDACGKPAGKIEQLTQLAGSAGDSLQNQAGYGA